MKRYVEMCFMVGAYFGLRALELVGSIERISAQQRAEDWASLKEILRDTWAGKNPLSGMAALAPSDGDSKP